MRANAAASNMWHGSSLPERARALAQNAASEPVTVALLVLLVVAWCAEGAHRVAGLPHAAVGVVDAGEALLCAWLAIDLIRARRLPQLPFLAVIYVLWVGVGLVTAAPEAAVVASLEDAVLLPFLAFLLVGVLTTERRARALVAMLFVLAAFEFVLTLVQSLETKNADAIVGTFGPHASAITGAVVLMVACVGVAGYLVCAPWAVAGLAAAAILPLFAAWALVTAVPLFLPVAALVVAIAAVAAGQVTWRRAAIAVLALAASACLVVASYAVFHPGSFDHPHSLRLLLKRTATQTYLGRTSTGSPAIASAMPAPSGQAQLGNLVVASYANATVTPAPWTASTPEGEALLIRNGAGGGDYTVEVMTAHSALAAVEEGKPYVFSAQVEASKNVLQTITAQIEWRGRDGAPTTSSFGTQIASFQATSSFQRLVVEAVAPAGATAALPKIAVTGSPAAGARIFVRKLDFGRRGAIAPQPPAREPVIASLPEPSSLLVERRPSQWRMAADAISSPLATRLFGKGLGAATVAGSLGVEEQTLPPELQAASKSDLGSLLVERGWTGVVLTALLAVAVCGAAFRIACLLSPARWTTALTVAVPGVVAVMVSYGMIATLLRNRPAALTFWLIVALGLSPETALGTRRHRAATGQDGARSDGWRDL